MTPPESEPEAGPYTSTSCGSERATPAHVDVEHASSKASHLRKGRGKRGTREGVGVQGLGQVVRGLSRVQPKGPGLDRLSVRRHTRATCRRAARPSAAPLGGGTHGLRLGQERPALLLHWCRVAGDNHVTKSAPASPSRREGSPTARGLLVRFPGRPHNVTSSSGRRCTQCGGV